MGFSFFNSCLPSEDNLALRRPTFPAPAGTCQLSSTTWRSSRVRLPKPGRTRARSWRLQLLASLDPVGVAAAAPTEKGASLALARRDHVMRAARGMVLFNIGNFYILDFLPETSGAPAWPAVFSVCLNLLDVFPLLTSTFGVAVRFVQPTASPSQFLSALQGLLAELLLGPDGGLHGLVNGFPHEQTWRVAPLHFRSAALERIAGGSLQADKRHVRRNTPDPTCWAFNDGFVRCAIVGPAGISAPCGRITIPLRDVRPATVMSAVRSAATSAASKQGGRRPSQRRPDGSGRRRGVNDLSPSPCVSLAGAASFAPEAATADRSLAAADPRGSAATPVVAHMVHAFGHTFDRAGRANGHAVVAVDCVSRADGCAVDAVGCRRVRGPR